jgi:hypothetical protein
MWPRLPDSVAIHFNGQLQPDLWMPNSVAVGVLFHLLVASAVVATIGALRSRPLSRRWIISSTLWQAALSVCASEALWSNVTQRSPRLWPAALIFIAAVAAWAVPGVRTSSAVPGQSSDLAIAEQVHRSWPQAVLFLLLTGLPLWMLVFGPRSAMVVLVPINLLMLYGLGAFVGGFRYRILPEGIEVRNMFRRLTYIAVSEIEAVDVCETNALADWGGWGVRGSSRARAFILGGEKTLHLKLRDRELWLGLKNAEQFPRIVEEWRGRTSSR